MTLLADYLRDNQGNVLRVYPDALGELHITLAQWDSDDGGWTGPTYVIPTEGYEYRTLVDSAGVTWYVYLVQIYAGDETHWEITMSTVIPTAQPAGLWRDCKYGGVLVETDAVIGSEVYLLFRDVSSTTWYVYPTVDGDLMISTTQPV